MPEQRWRDGTSARHIWLPSNRSLCELSVRRVATSAAEADAENAISRDLPGCEACVIIVDMLKVSADTLRQSGATIPSRRKALDLLSGTTWPWVASSLNRKERTR